MLESNDKFYCQNLTGTLHVKLKSIECQKLDGLTDTPKNFREGVRKIVLCTFNFLNRAHELPRPKACSYLHYETNK